jgi:GT2 family glycosyltransferase
LAREGFDYLWILNNDTRVDPESLNDLIKSAESETDVEAVGSGIFYMNDPEKVQIWDGGKVSLWCGTSRQHARPSIETVKKGFLIKTVLSQTEAG